MSHTVYETGGTALSEHIPSDAPVARGEGFTMRLYVDANHTGDSVTRRSKTGFLVYLKNVLVHCYLKKQPGIETSSFGSEFMALKVATKYV